MTTQKSILSGMKMTVLGGGHMGGALIRALVERSVYPQNISLFDIDPKKVSAIRKDVNVRASRSARQAVSLADVVILAVKPQSLAELIGDIATSVPKDALVISIAAGVPIARIESYFKRPLSVIRVMPNMPALVGSGMSAFSLGRHATGKHRRTAEAILSAFGEAVEVRERMLDLVTAVSGSGPAYYFLLTEKLIEAGYELGMKADVAKKLAYQTAFGSGRVLAESTDDPDALIAKVASKGGTTEAALKVFKRMGFGKIVHDAVKAAYKRSKELSKS